MHQDKTDTLALLREKIRRMEAPTPVSTDRLPTGFAALDAHLDGGLARGCVHEVFSTGRDSLYGSRSAAFVAHVLARTTGPVIWASEDYPDLSAPGIRQSGLNPGRLLCVTTRKGGLEALCEDMLNERGVCALVADLRTPLSLTQSRRHVLAASRSQVSGFLLCRTAGAVSEPPASASMTRWRIGGTTQSLQLGLSNASADPVRLNRLLGERIETIEPGFGIEAFTLSATETAPLDSPANRDWLTPATDPTGLPALLERLMGRVGIQSLSRLQTGASQFPEREQAYTGGECVQKLDEHSPSCSHGPRPARLLPTPCPITVRAFWPDGAPKAFQWGRTRHTIHGLIGPERVWSDWWHDPQGARARDYWVAETLEGERFWLFAAHDGAEAAIGQAAWFLHGLF